MKKIILCICLLFPAILVFGQSVNKTMLRLPDTGETMSYTSTFGEDADYTIHPPFFLLNGDGTVTDTVTGLMWQQTDGGEMTIEDAGTYCDTLTLGGFSDWRLPDAHEAFSILNHQQSNPALDAAVFTTTAAEYWWTRDRQANDSSKVWVTNAGGGIGNHPKTETISAGGIKRFHVRAVRDVLSPVVVPDHFTDNGDGTITDNLTLLTWQKQPYSDSLTWEQSLSYADTLSLAGQSDWRLPNIKELHSLNDERRIGPSVNTAFFPAIGVRKYWSSTTLPNQPAKAWYLDTQFGITTYDLKTARLSLMCVRGPQNPSTGLKELSDANWNVVAYPNPVSTFITVAFTSQVSQVIVVNLLNTASSGEQQLGSYMVKPGVNTIVLDGSGLPSGVYAYKLIADDNARLVLGSGKFIVVH